MRMKPVPVRIVSLMKACRNHANLTVRPNLSSQLTRIGMGMGMTIPPPRAYQLLTPPSSSSSSSSYGNPCLDLYFNVVKPDKPTLPAEAEANRIYLKQLLPFAWSHNPLTTLKLICNLLDRHCGGHKYHDQGFYTAAFWLHHNHPKTLASNLASIAGSFGGMCDLVQILYWILSGQDGTRINEGNLTCDDDDDDWCFEDETFRMVNKEEAVERYQRDPDYRFLHDLVSDLFTLFLKRDIQNLKRRMRDDNDNANDGELEITLAADYCDDRATLLCDTIARKVFPPDEEVEEANYEYRVRNQLMKEVLEPLRKASDTCIYQNDSNKWGYRPKFDEELQIGTKNYLEDVKSGNCEIEASALLPHEIIEYVKDEDFGQLAELQWKVMVEEQKQGKKILNKSLAVCNVSSKTMFPHHRDVSAGLGLLLSELNEEPAWKGKVMNFSRNPKLHSISTHDDLKSKCAYVRRMDCQDSSEGVDFRKVFDLILEVAVNENLRPEQMVKRVIVFTCISGFEFDGSCWWWEKDYEAIQSRYKERGYENVVPHLVVWDLVNLDLYRPPLECCASTQHGVTMLKGLSNNLIKSFLDNDGEIGPHHVMEAAISSQPYQSLVVVD